MSSNKTRLGISAYAITVFFVMLGGNGVRNTVGWVGFFVICALLVVGAVVLLVKEKPDRLSWTRMPKGLLLFLALAGLSIAWSAYRFESLLGFIAQLATSFVAVVLAAVLSWHEILRTLGTALRYLLGLSLVFEFGVELLFGRPILQNFITVENPEKPSKLFYWSRSLLFDGGPVQGLVANSVLLGFIALIGLIVFAIQLRAGLVRPFAGWFWVTVAVATLALTRSVTVLAALAVVVITLLFALWTRRVGVKRMPVYTTGAVLLAGSAAAVFFLRDTLLAKIGKSPTLTGRSETWEKVTALAEQKPIFGWGWVSHWTPWVEPFKSLDTKNGIQVMHAHNAWLDVWLQLGWVGVLFFAVLVLVTLQRVWCRAVDQPRRGYADPLPYATSSLFPLLVMTALFVQSFSESRILIEGGWLLLIIFAVKSRIDYELPTKADEPSRLPWSNVPISQESRAA